MFPRKMTQDNEDMRPRITTTSMAAGPLSVAAASGISGSSSGSSTRSNGEMISYFLNRIKTVEQAIQCIYGPSISLVEARQIAQDILGELEDRRHRGTLASQRTSVHGDPAKTEIVISNLRKIAKLRNYVYGVLSQIEDITDRDQIREIKLFADKINKLKQRGQVGDEINAILEKISLLQDAGLPHETVMSTLQVCKDMLSKLTIGHKADQEMTPPTEIQPLWRAMTQQVATNRTITAIGGTAAAIGSVAMAATATATNTLAATSSLVGQGLYTCFSTSYQIASLSLIDKIRQIRNAPSPMAAAGVVALESYLATATGLGNSLQLLEMLANARIDVGSALDEIIDDGQSLGTTEHRSNMSENSSIASSMAVDAAENEAALDAALAANIADDNEEDESTDIPINEINRLRDEAIGAAEAAGADAEALSVSASLRSNGERINESLLALRAIEGTAQNILQNISRLASISPIGNFNPNNIVLPLDDDALSVDVGSRKTKRKADVAEAISAVIGEIDMELAESPPAMSRTGSKMSRIEGAQDVTGNGNGSDTSGGRRKSRRSKRSRKTRKIHRRRRTRGCLQHTKGCGRLTKRGKSKRRSMKRR
jgi:hypothetical protein